MKNKNIFIVSQPRFPVPSINDGAIAFVIQDTIEYLNPSKYKVISIWDEKHKEVEFNNKQFLFIYRKSFFFIIFKKLISKWIMKSLLYPIRYSIYFDMLIGLIIYWIIYKPKIIVIHSTRDEWLINIKKIFSKFDVKIFWYHHTSEDQEIEEKHIKELNIIDGHIFVSEYSKFKYIQKVYQFENFITEKSYVIKNGINLKNFVFNPIVRNQEREKLGLLTNEFVIIYVGKIIPRKGLGNLVDAINFLSPKIKNNITLLLAGSFDYFQSKKTDYSNGVEEKIKIYKIKSHLLGYVPHKDIFRFFCASDLLVFPSTEEEGMPLTILEAQAMGLPVISSKVGGIEEVILNGVNGFTYPKESEPIIITKLIEQIYNEPSLREKFSKNSLNNVVYTFSSERMAKDFENLMNNELLNHD